MSCKPLKKVEEGSLHVLRDWRSGREAVFEWTGKSWSTPGTGWGTKPSGMSTLGWKYDRPADQKKAEA